MHICHGWACKSIQQSTEQLLEWLENLLELINELRLLHRSSIY